MQGQAALPQVRRLPSQAVRTQRSLCDDLTAQIGVRKTLLSFVWAANSEALPSITHICVRTPLMTSFELLRSHSSIPTRFGPGLIEAPKVI